MFGPESPHRSSVQKPVWRGVPNDLTDVQSKNLCDAGSRMTSQMFGPKTCVTRGPEWPHRCSVQKPVWHGVPIDLSDVWSKNLFDAGSRMTSQIFDPKNLCDMGSQLTSLWLKLWNLVEIVIFGRIVDEIVKSGPNWEIWSKLWNLVQTVKSGCFF